MNPPAPRRLIGAAAVALAIAGAGLWSATLPGGRALSFALALGAALGIAFQRSRFCFFCHARDFFEKGDARGLLAILLALAVGTVGTHLVLGSWLPVPSPGRLPPDAHIGPVSLVLPLAGFVFGLGMVISGSCLGAHWYRLGEGSPTAPFALAGAAAGFVLGFNTWNPLYSLAIATARPWWLPHHLGYAGSLAAHLAVFALVAAWLARKPLPATPSLPGPRSAPAFAAHAFGPGRWPYWAGGLAVGWLATLVLLRLKPLGVTAALGAAAREAGGAWGLVPARLEGLDELGGCATVVAGPIWQSANAFLVAGLAAGSLAAALASGQFHPVRPTPTHAVRGLLGGVLLGWGAMTALGCTVGTLLSGVMAGAASGWTFGAALFVAVAFGIRRGWAP